MIVDQAVQAVEPPRGKKMFGKLVVNVNGVRAYKCKDGSVRFQAQVRDAAVIARDPKGRKAISKSFDTRDEAGQWLDSMRANGEKVLAQAQVPSKMRMAELFAAYVKMCEESKPLPKEQVFMFNRLSEHPVLKGVLVSEIRLKHAREYCLYRKNVQGIHPSTILAEMIRVGVALRRVGLMLEWGQKDGGPAFNPMAGVMEVLKREGLVAESTERKRRPSGLEMDRLLEYFKNFKSEGIAIPMADIIRVAALNAFRRGEIVSLKRSDLRADGSAIACMRKDSSSASGKRECVVPLLPCVLEIIKAQPHVEGEDRIFPYEADTIGQRFADGCDALQIEDLRFHDLRHEAISALSSVLGMAEAMLVSGHKTTRAYLRYLQLEEEARRISQKASSVRLKTAQ